jgi:hypothetical protein
MHLARVSRNNALYILRLVDRRRIELLLHACKAHVLPLSLTAQKIGGDGRNRTYGVSDVTDLQSAAFAARHTSPD